MCRLLLSIYEPINTELLSNFFKQSDNKKNTPNIENILDSNYHLGGYGLAYVTNGTWSIYKSNLSYKQDTNHINICNEIIDKQPTILIGHLRNKGVNSVGDTTLENTHPFTYKKYLLVHNGFIRNFANIKNDIIKIISIKYINLIKGETDTEHIFYLLLSIIDATKNNDYYLAFRKLFKLFDDNNIELVGNFIFSDITTVIVIRYISKIFNKNSIFNYIKNLIHEQIFDSPSLFINNNDNISNTLVNNGSRLINNINNENKILISSEPLLEKYKLINKNSIKIYNLSIV